MNKFDRELIRFLIAADPSTLIEWYNRASDSDLIHANELMDQYARLLEDEVLCLSIEKQIEQMPVLIETQAVIASVRG